MQFFRINRAIVGRPGSLPTLNCRFRIFAEIRTLRAMWRGLESRSRFGF
jgi:hypothetical protein